MIETGNSSLSSNVEHKNIEENVATRKLTQTLVISADHPFHALFMIQNNTFDWLFLLHNSDLMATMEKILRILQAHVHTYTYGAFLVGHLNKDYYFTSFTRSFIGGS